jgi:CHAD domain-containing protein
MAIAAERGKLIFRKTERELFRLSSAQDPEPVHTFRITTRRLETLLEQLIPSRDRNRKKLLKMLDRIRRSAGKVRDIDVQLAALRTLKMPLEPRRKTQLVQELLELRRKHVSKLRKLLKKSDLRELCKRLKRASKDARFDTRIDPLTTARKILASVPISSDKPDEDALHRYRVVVKRARFAAEFAPPSAASKRLIAQLQRLQDVIGHWHDWWKLTDTALDRLGDVTESSLVAVLHNLTRAKFRLALSAVSTTAFVTKTSRQAPAVLQPPASGKTLAANRPGAAA